MIAVVDYRMGNLRSVEKALVTSDAEKLLNSEGVVLPGVGAFRDCMI